MVEAPPETDQGEVKQRPIWFNRPRGTRRSNDADTFHVIEQDMTSTSRLCTSALAAAAWMLFADPAVAADVSCPPAIDETPSVAQRDGAWTVVALPGERPLERVGVYLGTPAEPGAQVPDTTRKNRSHEVLTWNLPAPHGGTFWAGCHYVGTTALLLQALPPQARRCVATWDLLPSGRRQRLAAFRCD